MEISQFNLITCRNKVTPVENVEKISIVCQILHLSQHQIRQFLCLLALMGHIQECHNLNTLAGSLILLECITIVSEVV